MARYYKDVNQWAKSSIPCQKMENNPLYKMSIGGISNPSGKFQEDIDIVDPGGTVISILFNMYR